MTAVAAGRLCDVTVVRAIRRKVDRAYRAGRPWLVLALEEELEALLERLDGYLCEVEAEVDPWQDTSALSVQEELRLLYGRWVRGEAGAMSLAEFVRSGLEDTAYTVPPGVSDELVEEAVAEEGRREYGR